MSRDARLAGIFLVPVLAGALFSLSRLALEGLDVPGEDDYRAARSVLEESGYDRQVDAVAVLPPWSLRAHKHLRGLSPISGDLLEERPLHRYRRLFLVVEPDAGRWLDPVLEKLGSASLERDVGRITVYGFELGGPSVTYDFRERLFDADVVIEADGGVRARCDGRKERGWSCSGRRSWQRVTRDWLLVTENGDDVLWVHPPGRGEELVFRYRDVPLGDVLVVRAGHTRTGSDRAKAPVEVRVLVGDEEVARVTRDVRFHFRTDVLDTARFAGQRADVTFRISTTNNGSNHFAFDAWAANRRARPEGGAP